MEDSGEKLIKVRVKKGYTLHIGGEYYIEGEVVKVKSFQVEDQLWKIENVKEVVKEETEEQVIDAVPVEEPVPDSEGVKDISVKKPPSGRRLFKNKKD